MIIFDILAAVLGFGVSVIVIVIVRMRMNNAYTPVFGISRAGASIAGFSIGTPFRNTCRMVCYIYFPAYIG